MKKINKENKNDLILIAEDSPTQAEQLKYILEEKNYKVMVARDGNEALKLVLEHNPSVVISDIIMPEMQGFELCKRIKDTEATKDIPVILLTSLSDPGDVLDGLACGADIFITKPYANEYLLNSLERIHANSELRKNERVRIGVEMMFDGKRRFITADQQQILTLLLSTYEAAVQKNKELVQLQDEQGSLNEELKSANKELESFSYSISHDLRAPLRAIAGFATALSENYFGKIDDEGKRLINVIVDNTRKMGQLIEDLLAFSRLGRNDVVKGKVDMNKLFLDTWNEVKLLSSEMKINFNISKLPSITADASLLQHVITNLLSNAVKFTQPREKAKIEVGSFKKNGQFVYYVKDNGVGFDMKYADKLFSVFQRLHNSTEFEGTGIGLAIVHKIVQRHGGQVWAEAKVNEGATFYFSLPQNGDKK